MSTAKYFVGLHGCPKSRDVTMRRLKKASINSHHTGDGVISTFKDGSKLLYRRDTDSMTIFKSKGPLSLASDITISYLCNIKLKLLYTTMSHAEIATSFNVTEEIVEEISICIKWSNTNQKER